MLGIEFNLSLIAAILLIGGYSINDTIVLFDRLRSVSSDQDIQKTSFVSMIDEAIQLNLRRTIITSFTTILALICLIILAPTSLVHMPLVIIFGVIIGTYSSLFLSLNTVSSLNYEAVLKSAE